VPRSRARSRSGGGRTSVDGAPDDERKRPITALVRATEERDRRGEHRGAANALNAACDDQRGGVARETRGERSEREHQLLHALLLDGRAPFSLLADAIGTSEQTVARRYRRLHEAGAVRVLVLPAATDVATELLGFPTAASLWLSVAPGNVEQVGERLAELRQTTFVAAVTGPANVAASVVCRSAGELYDLLTVEIGAIQAIRSAEASPVIRRVKQAGTVLSGARLRL
jgi:DNA-binding Lrp family transcriptional regulator